MQCVILAGGKGSRLGGLTAEIPKSMVPVAGRPFLEIQLDLLRRSGVEEVVLCVGHLAEKIEGHFRDGRDFGVRLAYSREEGELLGTGGALRQAELLLRPEFLLLYGDSYLDIDYRSVFDYFSQAAQPVLMTVFRNDNRWVKSNVVFRDGMVAAYDKGGRDRGMRYLDYGLSVFSRDILSELPPAGPGGLDELFHKLARKGKLAGLEVTRRFYEIGTLEGLGDLRSYLKGIQLQ